MIFNVYQAFRSADVDNRLTSIEAKLTMMQWVLGGVGFGVLILVIIEFYPFLRRFLPPKVKALEKFGLILTDEPLFSILKLISSLWSNGTGQSTKRPQGDIHANPCPHAT